MIVIATYHSQSPSARLSGGLIDFTYLVFKMHGLGVLPDYFTWPASALTYQYHHTTDIQWLSRII
jgi:hypothetical protein